MTKNVTPKRLLLWYLNNQAILENKRKWKKQTKNTYQVRLITTYLPQKNVK